MAPAFVVAPAGPARAFAGAALRCTRPTPRPELVSMTAAPISRRDALAAAIALVAGATVVAPRPSFAKGGEGAKISIFGVGGASSPFVAGVKTTGQVQYSKFGDSELAVFKNIIDQSEQRVAGAGDSIKLKSWEDIRSSIRLEASGLRETIRKVNSSIDDPKVAKAADKAYASLKQNMENLDQACIQKNQDKAFKSYNALLKDISSWKTVAGF